MAYDKKPAGRGKGSGGFRPGQGTDKPQAKGSYGKAPAKPTYNKAHGDFGKPQGTYTKTGEFIRAKNPRPDRQDSHERPSRADAFFNDTGRGPGPRRAAPAGRPVPPAKRVDERPRREFRPAAPVVEQPVAFNEEDMPRDNILAGRNPIREAIKAGKTIDKLLVQSGELSGSARQIVAWAREARIVVQHVDKIRLDEIYPNHQGMIAFAAAAEYSTVDDIIAYAKSKGEEPFIVALDSITDPHNLGAIIRTAECAGAHGVIVTERRSALLTPSAVKASAGACEYQRIAKVMNLTRTLKELKEEGLWIIGADMEGEPALNSDLSGPIVLVVGSEGEGISHLVSKNCDKLVALPIKGNIDSLNASVAAGVLMYEVLRARS